LLATPLHPQAAAAFHAAVARAARWRSAPPWRHRVTTAMCWRAKPHPACITSPARWRWHGRPGESARCAACGWSQLVLVHRVLPRDPLSPDAMPADWNTATTERDATALA
jgi:acyl-CoA dehydrogenase